MDPPRSASQEKECACREQRSALVTVDERRYDGYSARTCEGSRLLDTDEEIAAI